MVHFTAQYLLNPTKLISVALVGVGGTGSQMLGHLARIDTTLQALGHPGLYVHVYDDDQVSEANIGRQLFAEPDLGLNKATVLVSRLNRFFGLNWEAHPEKYVCQLRANIIITCVDSAKARIEIKSLIKSTKDEQEPDEKALYWLDMGNGSKSGQVVLGTVKDIQQPKSKLETKKALPDVLDLYPQIKKVKDKDDGPSCSLAEAIKKQDLFVNPIMATLGADILWKLFREGMITSQGCFVNLDTFHVNPIKIF